MSIFGTIMEKIFHAPEAARADAVPTAATLAAPAAPPAASSASEVPAATPGPTAEAAATGPREVPPSAQAAPVSAVDVVDVLTKKAAQKDGGGNWQTSIVDLLKLLDLDSSLASRKELATELNVHIGDDGSAEENIALHKAVMSKLAENGGTVPSSFKS